MGMRGRGEGALEADKGLMQHPTITIQTRKDETEERVYPMTQDEAAVQTPAPPLKLCIIDSSLDATQSSKE